MKESMKYDTDYYQLRDYVLTRMLEIIKNQKEVHPNGLVFFGDSITEMYNIEDFLPTIKNKYNCGISGITSDMLLHILDEAVIKYQPSQVVLMIGTNDLGNTTMASPRQIAIRVKEICELIHFNLPKTHIYLLSCLPCLEELQGYKKSGTGMRSNDLLKLIFKEYKNIIHYDFVSLHNVYPAFCNKKGLPRQELFLDGLHLNEEGYKIYSNEIIKVLHE